MKANVKGFTLVELLVVIGIIALLLGLALPALNEARTRAQEVADRASLSSVSTAIEVFADDHGGWYPDSSFRPAIAIESELQDACNVIDVGAHRLAEALFGLDRLGYTRVDNGVDDTDDIPDGIPDYFVSDGDNSWTAEPTGAPVDSQGDPVKRLGPYVRLESVIVGTMKDTNAQALELRDNTNAVLLDKVNSRAILYYEANQREHLISRIYDYDDNKLITADFVTALDTDSLYPDINYAYEFHDFIWDKQTGWIRSTGEFDPCMPSARPVNKDTFLLIAAGRDGLYGTRDDIRNWQ